MLPPYEFGGDREAEDGKQIEGFGESLSAVGGSSAD